MWHVTLTVGGVPKAADDVRSALDRLVAEQPFLLSARYASDRAELDYWEEAQGCEDAAALALRLWGEHRASADLPPWHVLGLEVVERETFSRRENGATPSVALAAVERLRSAPRLVGRRHRPSRRTP